METQRDSVRDFLQCRTIGVCIAHARLLGFHVVRSTRPCSLLFTNLMQPKEFCAPRDERHLAKFPTYPHPNLILSKTQKYFYRHNSILHLRLEQVVRYYSTGAWIKREEQTRENTIEEHDEAIP